MAAQTYDLFNYLFRSSAYPFIQQHVLGRHLLPNGQWASSITTLTDLDDYCFAKIFRYLEFRDLVRLRRVSRRLNWSVGEYFDTRKHFVYTCHVNGVRLDQNGHYQFNWAAFEFALQCMPNLRSLAFEKCSVMKHTLATCNQDLIERISDNLYDLKMLSITRSLAIKPQTICRLIESFPELSHLTISIFSEELLGTIVNGFQHLKYLNLAESILYDYAPILKRLGPKIKAFIAPADSKDHKMAIVEALCDGNGKKLERLEMNVCIHDLANDAEFFNKIGQEMKHLKWFQCELSCSQKQTTQNTSNHSDESVHSLSPASLELNQHSMSSICPSPYEHRHVNLVRGLSGLRNLRVLVLKEKDYFDSEDRCTILDDESLLEIFRVCSQLEMLTIACAIRRNQRNYHRYEFESKENAQDLNRLLSQIFNDDKSSSDSDHDPKRTSTESDDVRLEKKPGFNRNESVFGDMFETESDGDEHSLDSGISDSIQHLHTVSDSCLATLHIHLPKLRILSVRGVRISVKSMQAIANLTKLEFLRLDSITFNGSEPNAKDYFTEFIGQIAIANMNSKTNIRITNIPLL